MGGGWVAQVKIRDCAEIPLAGKRIPQSVLSATHRTMDGIFHLNEIHHQVTAITPDDLFPCLA